MTVRPINYVHNRADFGRKPSKRLHKGEVRRFLRYLDGGLPAMLVANLCGVHWTTCVYYRKKLWKDGERTKVKAVPQWPG